MQRDRIRETSLIIETDLCAWLGRLLWKKAVELPSATGQRVIDVFFNRLEEKHTFIEPFTMASLVVGIGTFGANPAFTALLPVRYWNGDDGVFDPTTAADVVGVIKGASAIKCGMRAILWTPRSHTTKEPSAQTLMPNGFESIPLPPSPPFARTRVVSTDWVVGMG